MKISGSWDKNAEKVFSYLSDLEYNKIHGFFLAYAADASVETIGDCVLLMMSDAPDMVRTAFNEFVK